MSTKIDKKQKTVMKPKKENNDLIQRDKILELMKMIDSRLKPDQEVINYLQDLVEIFVLESLSEMIEYSKHRGDDNTVDFKDAKLFYERKFKRSIPFISSVWSNGTSLVETISKSIKKNKSCTSSYFSHLQDFKKMKK